MARVLLVSLRSPFLDSDRVFPPIGLLQLKACLDAAGHECNVDDDPVLEPAYFDQGYDVIGFSVMTPQGQDARKALQALRSLPKPPKAVIGGPHALHYTDQVVEDPWDYIVRGDGERAIVQIANGETLPRVSTDQLSEDDMNATPRPWRDARWLQKYRYTLEGHRCTTMLTTRGCPMGCTFCEDRRTRVRHYAPARVREEIEDVMAAGFGSIMFFDDIFAMIPKRTKELTDLIRPYDLRYRCFAHANTLREDMAAQLASSGCVEIGFGCEHASQKILDTIGKGVKVHHNEEFLDRCKRHGIRVKAFFIVGLPGENHDTLRELEEFIARHTEAGTLYDFDATVYFPYRGTHIRDNLGQYDLQIAGEADSALGYYKGQQGSAEVVISTSALSGEEIREAKERIYRTYNRRFRSGVKGITAAAGPGATAEMQPGSGTPGRIVVEAHVS